MVDEINLVASFVFPYGEVTISAAAALIEI